MTRRRRGRAAARAVLVTLMLAGAIRGEAGPQLTSADQALADVAEVSDPRSAVSAERLRGLVESGLNSGSRDARRQALRAIAVRMGISRYQRGANADLDTKERRALAAARPLIRRSVSDADEHVRHEAVVAIAAVSLGGSNRHPVLDRQTLDEFFTLFKNDPSPLVRAELMKIVALTAPAQGPVRADMLREGLESADPMVVQYALRGVAGAPVDAPTLARIAALLRHANRAVRTSAAVALQRARRSGLAHLDALRAARDTEADVSTRSALQAVVRSLEQLQRP